MKFRNTINNDNNIIAIILILFIIIILSFGSYKNLLIYFPNKNFEIMQFIVNTIAFILIFLTFILNYFAFIRSNKIFLKSFSDYKDYYVLVEKLMGEELHAFIPDVSSDIAAHEICNNDKIRTIFIKKLRLLKGKEVGKNYLARYKDLYNSISGAFVIDNEVRILIKQIIENSPHTEVLAIIEEEGF